MNELQRQGTHTIKVKPWGKEIIWANNENYSAKILVINEGHRLSLQYHREKTETIMVLSGQLLVERQEGLEPLSLNIGDTLHVPPGMIHRFKADGGPVTLVEVSTSQLDDVIRLEDDYER